MKRISFSVPVAPLHISAILLTFGGIIFTVFAVPLYSPGETLEPACAPGATDCTVDVGSSSSLNAADGTPTDAVLVDNDGNVGIGTTSPHKRLHVLESGTAGTPVSAVQTVGIFQRSGTTTSPAMVSIISGNDSTAHLNFGDPEDEDQGVIFYSNTDGSMKFRTVSTNRMIIDGSGNVGIGTISPTSSLHVDGSLSLQQTTITGNTTLDNTHNVILANPSGNITITLPAAGSHTDKVYYIKKIDSDTDIVTIDGNGSETIDGASTITLYVKDNFVRIISDGSNWHTITKDTDIVLIKTADQVVNNSTTKVNDTHIQFYGEANTTYGFLLSLVYDAHATADFEFAWSLPSGASINQGGIIRNWSGSIIQDYPHAISLFGNGVGTESPQSVTGQIVIGGTPGVVNLQWAQSTATGPHASDTTLRAGSFLRAWPAN